MAHFTINGTPHNAQLHTFKLNQFHWIGFDLDHTLVRYKLHALNNLIYDILAKYLVQQKQYNAQLLNTKLNSDFIQRGIILDTHTGNFVKLRADKHILHAIHGTSHALSSDELRQQYSNGVLSEYELIDETSRRYFTFLTYFEICAMDLMAKLIDMVDTQQLYQSAELQSMLNSKTVKEQYAIMFADVYAAFNYHWQDFHSGDYFSTLQRDGLDKYCYKRADVREWLVSLRKHGIKLFMITNSRLDYTELLMQYSYGSDWHSLFDIVIVDAKKPKFFTEQQPYYAVNAPSLMPDQQVDALQLNHTFIGGNVTLLNQTFRQHTNGHTPRVIYFGDNLKADMYASKNQSNGWLAATLIEELEVEVPLTLHNKTQHCNGKHTAQYEPLHSSSVWQDFLSYRMPTGNAVETYWYRYIVEHSAIVCGCLTHLHVDDAHDTEYQYSYKSHHCFVLQPVRNKLI